MCGISGAIDVDPGRARARVAQLNSLQRHRGPDHTALASVGHCSVGNTRLAIQDLSAAGNQPLTSADGRYVGVFNGEIYNSRELQTRFSLAVRSQSDGAVIAPLWAMMGRRCLALLEGMWAIAIIDRDLKTVTIARDPFGIKPLFVRDFPDGSVAFASELRPLTRLGGPPEIDRSAFADFLRFGAMGREASPYRGISPLPPNTWMQIPGPSAAGAIQPPSSGKILSEAHPLTEPGDGQPWDLLLDSVERHLVADVPTALLLSSGLDSSLLACAAQRRGQSLDCFTVSLPGQADESGEAALTARHYGHRHQVVGAELAEDDLDIFFSSMQRPSIDGLNTYLVCKAIHTAGYRVALSGLGGDEAVAGYPHMRYFPLLRLATFMDRLKLGNLASRLPVRPKLAALLQSSGPRDAAEFDALFRQVLDHQAVVRLIGPVLASEPKVGSGDLSLRALIEEEIATYLQRTLLPDADTFSMRWSLELRVPFLDLRYFRAAAASARPFRGKAKLAAMAHDVRIDALKRRKKQGFSLPMVTWMQQGPLRAAVNDLQAPDAPIWDFLDRRAGREEIANTPSGRWAAPWALVVLDQWLRSQRSERTDLARQP